MICGNSFVCGQKIVSVLLGTVFCLVAASAYGAQMVVVNKSDCPVLVNYKVAMPGEWKNEQMSVDGESNSSEDKFSNLFWSISYVQVTGGCREYQYSSVPICKSNSYGLNYHSKAVITNTSDGKVQCKITYW